MAAIAMASFLKIPMLVLFIVLSVLTVYISVPNALSFATSAAPSFSLALRSWITPRCLFLYVNLIVCFIIRSEKQHPSDHGAASKHIVVDVPPPEAVPAPEIPSEEEFMDDALQAVLASNDAPVPRLKKSNTWERRLEKTTAVADTVSEVPAKREMRKLQTIREGRQRECGWRGRDGLFEGQEELHRRCEAFIRMNREQMRRQL